MGQGPFGFDRPGTAGDSGWFGAPRPLVGAANGIIVTVTTPSAAQVAVANSTPKSLQQLRDELNDVNREIANKESKLNRIEELGGFTELAFLEEIPIDVAERRVQNLLDEKDRLMSERNRLREKIDDKRMALEEGDIPNDEIKEGIEEPVQNVLNGMGISKGPVIDVGVSQTEIVFSMVNVREDDIGMAQNRLENIGFRVSSVEGIEV